MNGRLLIARSTPPPAPRPAGPDRLRLAGQAWQRLTRGQKWATAFVALFLASLVGAPFRAISEDASGSVSVTVLAVLGVLLLVGVSRASSQPAPPASPPPSPEQVLATTGTTEARVAGAASRAWLETVAEPSWQSPHLARSRASFDGQAEVDQIIDIALRINRARLTLGPRPDGPPAEYWARQVEALERTAHQLGHRADALIRYRDQAARLSQELRHLADLERLERSAAEIDGLTIETAYPSGRGDGGIGRLAEEMAAVRATMTELVDLMTRTRAPLADPPDPQFPG